MRRSCDSSGRWGERGFALLAVLGVAVALALIAAAAVREGRTAARVAANAVAAAEARAAAEAGLWRAAALWAAGADAPFAPWRFEGVAVTVEGGPERGRTDLNRAGAAALAAAAGAAGHPEPEAFAEAALARRAALAAAGVSWRLEARAFDSVEAARPLAPAEIWPRLEPLLTVHGERGGGGPDGGEVGEALRLRAQARHPSGARAAIEAVLRIGADGAPAALEWRGAKPGGAP
jgi:hypothetical protein